MNENRTKIERESSKKRIYNLLVYRVTIHVVTNMILHVIKLLESILIEQKRKI